MMEIITRAEAKARRLKRYFTGKACPHGHVVERFTRNGGCTKCEAGRADVWRTLNPEKFRQSRRRYRAANPRVRARAAARAKQWNANHPERRAEIKSESSRRTKSRKAFPHNPDLAELRYQILTGQRLCRKLRKELEHETEA